MATQNRLSIEEDELDLNGKNHTIFDPGIFVNYIWGRAPERHAWSKYS